MPKIEKKSLRAKYYQQKISQSNVFLLFSHHVFTTSWFTATTKNSQYIGNSGLWRAAILAHEHRMFSGKEFANFMAILGTINGVAPVRAPVVGGLMAGVTDWQGVFGLLLGIGIILMVCSCRLPAAHAPALHHAEAQCNEALTF